MLADATPVPVRPVKVEAAQAPANSEARKMGLFRLAGLLVVFTSAPFFLSERPSLVEGSVAFLLGRVRGTRPGGEVRRRQRWDCCPLVGGEIGEGRRRHEGPPGARWPPASAARPRGRSTWRATTPDRRQEGPSGSTQLRYAAGVAMLAADLFGEMAGAVEAALDPCGPPLRAAQVAGPGPVPTEPRR